MTRNQRHAFDCLEAERYRAAQAKRERSDWRTAAWINALERAGELAQAGRMADSRRVVELAIEGLDKE